MTECSARDVRVVTIENRHLSVKVVPELGGKILSVVSRRTGHEWMWQHPGRPLIRPPYGGEYTRYNISGFDECFPTVEECPYPEDPWKGEATGDHGEVWSLPWELEEGAGGLRLVVSSRRFSYQLAREISMDDTSPKLRLTYDLRNLSDAPFKCIWSAHCLLPVGNVSRILLPESERVVEVDSSRGNRLGPPGSMHPWPVTRDTGGKSVDLSEVRPNQGFADKLFAKGRGGWCALHDEESGETTAFTFPPDKVPYVGLWINQGGWSETAEPYCHVGLEPCTGCRDRLDLAAARDSVTVVPPASSVSWDLVWSFGRYKKIHGVAKSGDILGDES
ncbi:MAG: DUF5107 domain-containing protein [Firmicutes bacterium]|nr:DUF5107 domain-containing protein [Bacillota bacterium]